VDENTALLLVTVLQQLAREQVDAHGGRIVKFLGDAVLADFNSSDSALRAALALRDNFAVASEAAGTPAKLRIGVHVGDVLGTPDGDLYGDGVNLASRVQGAADPGQVCVTQDVWNQLRQRRDFRFESVGQRKLKGLDAVWMFTAGMASSGEPPPPPPPPVPTSSVRLARILRLALVYGVSALVLFQLTGILGNRFGLPAWVTPAGLLLLLVGFVVMVATGWVQTRSPWQRSAGEPTDPWKVDVEDLATAVKRKRFPTLTWGRALLGGVLAFSLLFGGAGAYVLLKDGDLGFAPRPAAAQPGAAIAVLPFQASGADSDFLSEGVMELLAWNLREAGGFRVADPRSVSSRWRDRGQVGDSAATVGLGRQVGARYAVSGQVEKEPERLTITAEVYDTETGAVLGTPSVSGRPEALSELLDQIAQQVFEAGLGEGEVPDFDLGRLATPSMPALLAYIEGMRQFRRLQLPEAQDRFREAIEADPTFAQAQYGFSLSAGWSTTPHSLRQDAYSDAAVRYAADLPERDRMLVLGYDHLIRRDSAAVPTLERLTESYPDFVEGWFLLGDAYYHRNSNDPRFREALDSALALDPTFGPAYVHLVLDAKERNDTQGLQGLLATVFQAVDPLNPLRQAFDHLLEQTAASTQEAPATASGAPAPDAPARAEYASSRRAADGARTSALASGASGLVRAFARGDSLRSAALVDATAGEYATAAQRMEQARQAYDQSRSDLVWELRVDSALASLDALGRSVRLPPDGSHEVQALRRQASDARARGSYRDALGHLASVAERYRAAAATPQTQAQAPSAGTRDVPAEQPPAAEPQPTRVLSAEEIAAQILGELQSAYQRKDVQAIRVVWTNLSDQGAAGLEEIFRRMRTVTVTFETISVTQTDDRITLRNRMTMEGYSEFSGRDERQRSPEQTFQLAQRNGRWVIVAGP
jgi:TolB-like protein